ncbi:MAG UNVERIFIED_CONTAM: hypothetical protein LVT10_26500 [Anaerolineae bacterium]
MGHDACHCVSRAGGGACLYSYGTAQRLGGQEVDFMTGLAFYLVAGCGMIFTLIGGGLLLVVRFLGGIATLLGATLGNIPSLNDGAGGEGDLSFLRGFMGRDDR